MADETFPPASVLPPLLDEAPFDRVLPPEFELVFPTLEWFALFDVLPFAFAAPPPAFNELFAALFDCCRSLRPVMSTPDALEFEVLPVWSA
ncbi:hypothetical protein BSIN_5425 [Burkholderia singularis]|uniref:Uncharacterized protein n=1 Tax=Burkholderia singularis TaxID=1503053 RepID=A0A238HC98_9BURK|nr:hypothetical protein BSIN_5425 [Burkholderia singularis]